jgi:hypothetical protein
VEKELKRLQSLGVVEPAVGPTPWVSRLVCVPKDDGNTRLTMDLRDVNKFAIRERTPIPTLAETLDDLDGATVFSKLDLNQSFFQFELDQQSRSLTTFSTHLGLMRLTRLPQGFSGASEILQSRMRQIFHDCKGIKSNQDDILVFGRTAEEHDANLTTCLQPTRKHQCHSQS